MSLFKEVQYQLKKLNKPDYSKREIAFAGLIKCGHCGNLITGDIKKGKYIYYRCTHSKQKCPDKYIREEKLDDQFASIVKSFSITKEQFEWMVKGLKEINKVKDCEVKERTKQITLEIEKWNLRLSKLYEDKLDEVIREDFYIQKSRDWNEKIADYQEQLTKLKQASKEQMELGLTILDFAKDAHSLYKKLEKFERVKFLKIIVSNSTLKNGILDVELKKPFDALVKIGQNERTYPQCA
jgi:hypothetical protein